MPTADATLTLESARRSIGERSFHVRTGDRVGVEVEWFTTPSDDPPWVPELERSLRDVPLTASVLTFEPGAQIELSSQPFGHWAAACDALRHDGALIRRHLVGDGIELFASGLDPQRSLELRTDHGRYVAMRRYFDAYGRAAGRMMCASAAVHVNLDGGDDEEGTARWEAAHAVGPTLVAAFANSAIADGRPTGWKSSRMDAWATLDPTRTTPVDGARRPCDAWAEYALDALVMFIRADGRYETVDEPLTMREWIASGHRLGYPDEDDLAYHLTTLFPPVRPRGWLELRMIDMLPAPWWRVAVAIATTVVCDARARAAAVDACRETAGLWALAARCGAEDPRFARSTRACFEAALSALGSAGCDRETLEAAEEYEDRFVARGRCPADEQLGDLPTVTRGGGT